MPEIHHSALVYGARRPTDAYGGGLTPHGLDGFWETWSVDSPLTNLQLAAANIMHARAYLLDYTDILLAVT